MASAVASCNASPVLILDGGFSSQLSCHVGVNVDGDPLWSARFLRTHPEEVIQTHLDFLQAGADIIMTNTYQASVGGFVKHLDVTPEEGLAIIRSAVDFAKRARNIYLKECNKSIVGYNTPMVVGSVGPYGAHLHDGSEYDGSYADRTSAETMKEWHLPRIKALVEEGVDLLAFETLPCQKEAEVLIDILKEFPGTKAWLTFSCKDEESLAHGENFQEVARKCWSMNPEQLVAIGVNCCPPKIVRNLFYGINEGLKSPIPLIAYPNSGEKYNVEIGWIDRDKCESIETFVPEWLDLGVKYVGGCCRTYAADITRIKAQARSWVDNREFEEK